MWFFPNFCNSQWIFFPDHAVNLLEQEIKRNNLVTLDKFSIEDNPINRELFYLYSMFIKFLFKTKKLFKGNGRYEKLYKFFKK